MLCKTKGKSLLTVHMSAFPVSALIAVRDCFSLGYRPESHAAVAVMANGDDDALALSNTRQLTWVMVTLFNDGTLQWQAGAGETARLAQVKEVDEAVV